MINTLLAGVGIPALIAIIKKALCSIKHPAASAAADALNALETAISSNQINKDDISKANLHIEKMYEIEAALDEATIKQINETFRQESVSEDAYVRRWRPTFGYAVAFTWILMMSGLAYVIVFKSEQAPNIINALVSCSALWSVALGVLGLSVIKRSQDKITISGKNFPVKSNFFNFNKE